MIQSDTRKDWEIHWHIRLQYAAWAARQEVSLWRAIKLDKQVAIERAVNLANALVAEHGVPGSAALNAATGSLAVLRDGGYAGLVNTALTPRTDEERLKALRDTTPSWAHGTKETNPHWPYEGPAMGRVHA